MALEKAGGYYFSTGGSEAIVRGEIEVKQGEIASFEPGHTVVFKDGSKEQFDVVVFATGYTGFPDTVRATLGEQYVDTFSPVWGLDPEGEIRGVARDTNIPNTFFAIGALAGSRITSKVIALQILAQRLGVFGERCEWLLFPLSPVMSCLVDGSRRWDETAADDPDSWEKQKANGELVDATAYKAYEGMKTHPTPIKDYE